MLPWAIALSVLAGAVVAVGLRWGDGRRPARATTAVLVVAALVVGGGAVWTVVDVGHSGAAATWHDVTSRRE